MSHTWIRVITNEEIAAAERRGCVIAPGRRDRHGYVRVGKRMAHRVAWEDAHGPIPRGLVVMHSCDMPPCRTVDPCLSG